MSSSPGFFQSPLIPQQPNPVPPWFGPIGGQQANNYFRNYSNPWGMTQGPTGPSALNPYAGRGTFNPYTGGYGQQGGGQPHRPMPGGSMGNMGGQRPPWMNPSQGGSPGSQNPWGPGGGFYANDMQMPAANQGGGMGMQDILKQYMQQMNGGQQQPQRGQPTSISRPPIGGQGQSPIDNGGYIPPVSGGGGQDPNLQWMQDFWSRSSQNPANQQGQGQMPPPMPPVMSNEHPETPPVDHPAGWGQDPTQGQQPQMPPVSQPPQQQGRMPVTRGGGGGFDGQVQQGGGNRNAMVMQSLMRALQARQSPRGSLPPAGRR